ncbi:MAG: hypothetical protein WCX48_06265 [Bacteroidales bacterium]
MFKPPKKTGKEERKAKIVGAGMTVGLHLLILVFLFSTGLKAVSSHPAEAGIEVNFEKEPLIEPSKPIEVKSGNEPKADKPNPKDDIRLVQRSESAIVGKGANKGAESTMGDKGDVEQYEAPRSKPINRRALFPSAANRDSAAPQVAREISDRLTAGHAEGNTRVGSIEGEPSARLAGRSLMGNLPEPEYAVNKSGKVIVKISVDQYGTVISATPGISGTTVQDKTLWEAAKKAALKAKFNLSSSAPAVQEGTITYIFKLK